MIMGRAAVPPGKPGRNGHARAGREGRDLYLTALGEEDLQPGDFVLPGLQFLVNTLATVSPRKVASF
jgi:hypothetical protein